jgi:hypothetical protein
VAHNATGLNSHWFHDVHQPYLQQTHVTQAIIFDQIRDGEQRNAGWKDFMYSRSGWDYRLTWKKYDGNFFCVQKQTT